MPASNREAKRMIEAMRHVAQEEDHQTASFGEVVSIHGNFLRVRIKGAPGSYLIEKPTDKILEIGDRCLVVRPTKGDAWTFAGEIGGGSGTTARSSAVSIIMQIPPTDVALSSTLGGFLASWKASPYKVLSYHCQVADDDSGTNTEDFYISGSSFAYFGAYNATKYFRVRAVSDAMKSSPYSIWHSVTLGNIDWSSVVGISDLSDVSLVSLEDGDILQYDSSSELWLNTTYNATLGIDDLTDVDTSTAAPTDGQVLTWDDGAGQWEPADGSVVGSIDDLTDVDTSTVAPIDGQALVWDDANSIWEPGDVSGGSAGTVAHVSVTKEDNSLIPIVLKDETLSSASTSFTSLSATFSDYEYLTIDFSGKNASTSGGGLGMRINNDTGSNYELAYHYAGGSSHSASASTDTEIILAPIRSVTSTATTKLMNLKADGINYPTALMFGGLDDGTLNQNSRVTYYNDNSTAVTSLQFAITVNQLAAGSRLVVTGWKKSSVVTDVENAGTVFELTKETYEVREEIASETLTSAGTFAGLTDLDLSEYDYLELEGEVTGGTSSYHALLFRFNGDTTTSNYETTDHAGGTYHTTSIYTTDPGIRLIWAANNTANQIKTFRSTIHHKINVGYRTVNTYGKLYEQTATQYTSLLSGIWKNNSDAVTQIELVSSASTTFGSGSWYKLVGVKNAEVVTDVSGVDMVAETETVQTHTVLWKKTLTSAGNFDTNDTPDTGSIDISGYDHLLIRGELRSDEVATYDIARMYFNGDTTLTNYYQSEAWKGSADGGGNGDYPTISGVPAASSLSNCYAFIEVHINDYENTSRNKQYYWWNGNRRQAAEQYVQHGTANWESTAAINRITIQTNSDPTDEFVAGSWIEIIGIKETDVVTGVQQLNSELTTTSEELEIRKVIGEETLTSAGSFAALTSLDLSDYDYLEMQWQVQGNTATNESIALEINSDTTVGNYATAHHIFGTSTSGNVVSTIAGIFLGQVRSNTSGDTAAGWAIINHKSVDYPTLTGMQSDLDAGSSNSGHSYAGFYKQSGAVTALKVINNGGTSLAAGSWYRITGVKKQSVLTGVDGFVLTDETASAGRVLLDQQTLSANATSVTLTVPTSPEYNKLVLEWTGRSDYASTHDGLVVAINNDTTAANYHQAYLTIGTTGTPGGTQNSNNLGRLSAASANSADFGTGRIVLWNHNNTSIWVKGFFEATGSIAAVSGPYGYVTWQSTAQVTSIVLTPNNGTNFVTGSDFRLYGER